MRNSPLESDQILAWFRLLYLRLGEEFLISFLRNREVLYYLLVTELIHALYSPVEFSTETKVDKHFAAARDRRFDSRKNAVEGVIDKECLELGLLFVHQWPQTY